MKNNLLKLTTIGLLMSLSFTQEIGRKGIGFEFHTFPSVLMMEEGGSALGIYFPIETGTLLIEPQISYYSYIEEYEFDESFVDDYEYLNSTFSLLLVSSKYIE